MLYQVELKEYASGATSAIDTVEAAEGYTAEQYIADCESNADVDWCEMLNTGEVIVTPIEVSEG